MWSRLPPFWRLQLAGWFAFLMATLPLKWVALGSIQMAFVVSLYREGMGFLTTWGMREIYRRMYREGMGIVALCRLIFCVSLLGASIQSFLCLAFHDVFDLDEEKIFKSAVVFAVIYFRTGLCFAWSFLYFVIKLWREKKDRDLRVEKEKVKRHEAEVQMLRAQMNPHFLFNAFNLIQAKVEGVNPELGRMVQSLSDFLRFSLDHSDDDFIPVGREFDAMRDYLAVEGNRFHNKLEFHCEIDDEARAVLVPGIILQPLVENAIKYGSDTSEPPLRIRVHVARRGPITLQITVSNSGRWLEPQRREKDSHIGLQNLRRRLGLIYPDKHSLDIAHSDGWVTITICIPIL